MKILLLITAFSLAALVDIPKLIKNKQIGELVIFIILILAGFTLSFLLVIGINIPNPNKGIEFLIKLFA